MRVWATTAFLHTAGTLVTACGPSAEASLVITRLGDEPTAIVFTCEAQPRFTVRVYYGEQGVSSGAPGVRNYTLTGRAEGRQPVLVPLQTGSNGWVISGQHAPLPEGTTVEADTEAGSGTRLGAAAYFTPADLPDSPVVVTSEEGASQGRETSLGDFTASALTDC